MNDDRPDQISGTAITAISLGAVGLLCVAVLFPLLKVLGALLAVVAVIVGGLAVVNARRRGARFIAPAVGAGLGLVALAWFAIWWAIFAASF